MKRNGIFNYRPVGNSEIDPTTGYFRKGTEPAFVRGCECQIDKSIPAKQIIGADGQKYAYTYDVFFFRIDFKGELSIGDTVEVISEDGYRDEFTIRGIDINRKYIELWG